MITPQKIQQLTPELSLYRYHEIDVLRLQHAVGSAEIALQGAHLLRWQPVHATQQVLWLSDIEPFNAGEAIRGGVPICYPWFGMVQQPIHGTARLRLWQLSDYLLESGQVRLNFSLFDDKQRLEATLSMIFSDKCELIFTHHAPQSAQAALHSYFYVDDVRQIEIAELPPRCFNAVSRKLQDVPTSRTISENVDCIYSADSRHNRIIDPQLQREIRVTHSNASEIVLWNPWQTPLPAMQPNDYQKMICLETARISQPLHQGESISVEVAVVKA
ncbi:D-hexose-6-phosphate mutarotase [Testudinibacter sp. P27/CKL/0425]